MLGLAWPARRYRCRSCGWEGLQLPVWRQRPDALRRFATIALLALTGAALLLWSLPEAAPDEAALMMVGGEPFGAGEHFEGIALPASHPLARSGGAALDTPAGEADSGEAALDQPGDPAPIRAGLALRRFCVWGDPERNPYQGTVAQALRAAGLPEEVVEDIADHARTDRPQGRVSIRRDQIRAEGAGLVFNPRRMALASGLTLCLDTAVNFGAGREASADLFVATDDLENRHYVMIPEESGNVAVLQLADLAANRRR